MRKTVKTVIKEFLDDNVISFDIPFLTALLERVKSPEISSEDLNRIIKNIVTHGSETSTLTMSDYDHIMNYK